MLDAPTNKYCNIKSVPYLGLHPASFFNLLKCHLNKKKRKAWKCKIYSVGLFGGETSQVDVEVHLEE